MALTFINVEPSDRIRVNCRVISPTERYLTIRIGDVAIVLPTNNTLQAARLVQELELQIKVAEALASDPSTPAEPEGVPV